MIGLYISLGFVGLLLALTIIAIILARRYKVSYEGHYVPHVFDKYPDCESGNFWSRKKIHNFNYNDSFHYIYGQTFTEKIVKLFTSFVILFLIPVVIFFDGGSIYKGRRKFRKYRRQFKDGFITVCNHCYMYDILMIRTLSYGHKMFYPLWKEGAEGPSGTMYRAGGGLPMEHTFQGMLNCYREMEKVLNQGHHLHVFPEQAGWFYYGAVREFKNGAFRIAYDLNKPIIPLGINFRKRTGLFRLLGSKNKPLVCLSVGDPIYPNKDNDKAEEVNRLINETRTSVMHLAGIENEEANNLIKNSYQYYKYDASKSSWIDEKRKYTFD